MAVRAPVPWTRTWIAGVGLSLASVAVLLALQSRLGTLVSFWPFLLAAPVSLALVCGPLWGCFAALAGAAGQLLLPYLAHGAAPTERDMPAAAAFLGTGILAAAGTHFLRRSHVARREEARESTSLLRLATVSADPSSLPALMNAAVGMLPELTGRAVCALFLRDPGRDQYALAQQSPAPAGRSPLPPQLTLDPERLPALKDAASRGAPSVASQGELAASPYGKELDFDQAALVPLVNWGRVLGCLLLAGGVRGRKGEYLPAPFTPRDLETARALSSQVAVAIENARLYDEILKQKELLEVERQRSERLLLNILPQPIADRLKQEESTIADSFAEVTVLFADIVDFTPLSARLEAEALVNLLNDVFSAFDELADHYRLEKIKTIGDAYMVVGGLPEPREDHVEAIAEMALAMQDRISRFPRDPGTGEPLRLRIGIHSGRVVAGVIGTRKFIYDLWGDTVNTASRMESNGLPGSIQVTEAAYLRLRDRYAFEARGPILIKGKGEMEVYLLTGRREEPSRPDGESR